MATILVCDRCKKQLPTTSYRRIIVRNAADAKMQDIDLCRECYELIEDAIMNSYKYDIIDKTAGDPLKDHYDACIHFVDERKEI